MKRGAKIFEGTHDFSTFRAASCSAKSPIKRMYPIKINKKNDMIKIKIISKSFLQNQVRSMVGSLIYLSTGKWSFIKFKKAFRSKNRINCATPAPACGLYLQNIKYKLQKIFFPPYFFKEFKEINIKEMQLSKKLNLL